MGELGVGGGAEATDTVVCQDLFKGRCKDMMGLHPASKDDV